MPIADITKKILDDASKEAAAIVNEAKDKAKNILETLETEKEILKKKNEEAVKKTLEENERRIISAAEQEVKMRINNYKRNLIDEVFNTALNKITKLPEKDYASFLKKILSTVPKNKTGKIFIPKERAGITKKILTECGFENKTVLTDKFSAGIIIENDTFEYNLTFKNILADKKNALEVDVAKLLFS